MQKISRRELLRYLVSGAAVLTSVRLLGACRRQSLPFIHTPSQIPTNDPTPTKMAALPSAPIIQPSAETADLQTLAQPSPQPSATAVIYPDLVVSRQGKPEDLVKEAISALGGMKRFVPTGGWVIIKPNICTAYHTYEYAATTNPWVVGTLVKLCFEAGAGKVQVMDFPFGGSASDAYRISGIAEQVENNGGEMVRMSSFKFKEVIIENALSLNRVEIYEDVFKADTLINVPIAKNHGLATLTLGMKNLMGLITNRGDIHMDFGKRLTDLAMKIRPTLTVIDAVRILLRNGPTGGDLGDVQELDTLIASTDILAADSYAATLFGLQPDDLENIREGARVGLGVSDLSKLNLQEIILE